MDAQPTKSMVLPIAIAVLISALIFGVGGYYLASNQSNPVVDNSDALTTPSPKATTTATASATASKTYENKTFNFTMQYPSGWNVRETASSTNGDDGGPTVDVLFYKGSSAEDIEAPSLTVSVNPLGRGLPGSAVKYSIAYTNGVMSVTNRTVETATPGASDELQEIVPGYVSFRTSNSANITLNNKSYSFFGRNLDVRADEDAAVAIVSSFKFTK